MAVLSTYLGASLGIVDSANAILEKLKTVDGPGSGLNADLLENQEETYYTNASNLASGTVPTARLGSGTADATTYLAGDQTFKTFGLTVTDDSETNSTFYVPFVNQTSGTENTLTVTSSKLTYNPLTGTISTSIFSGDSASITNIIATNVTASGDVTASSFIGDGSQLTGAGISTGKSIAMAIVFG